MFYWGFKFPHIAMVRHALEGDAANTSLSGHSSKNKVHCWF